MPSNKTFIARFLDKQTRTKCQYIRANQVFHCIQNALVSHQFIQEREKQVRLMQFHVLQFSTESVFSSLQAAPVAVCFIDSQGFDRENVAITLVI